MNQEDFNKAIQEQVARSLETLTRKGEEYATEDRLHNFKMAAGLQGITQKQALAALLAKHIVSVYDMIWTDSGYPISQWNEKIGDSINYLLILRAMVDSELFHP